MNALRSFIPARLLTAGVLALAAPAGRAQIQPAPKVPLSMASRTSRTQPRRASVVTPPQPSGIAAINPPAPTPVSLNRRVIVLDPAHGGSDSGAQISDTTVEKDVTLAFAFRLRAMLSARGFTVVMTRDSDTPTAPSPGAATLTLDDRAGVANHAHAAACLLLHASGTGDGVHLYDSELEAASGATSTPPWLTAQAAWVSESVLLENELASALTRSEVPLVTGNASVRPMDSLTCPALVVELAPASRDVDSINQTDYQQRIALAIAGALLVWENKVQAPPRISSAPAAINPAINPATVPRSRAGVQP